MKAIMKGAIKDEKGAALALVLVLLVVGGLVLTPLLGLMSTGLLAGQVYERKMDDYYTADAGVEDAIWKIKYDPPDSYPYVYPEPLIVDGKSVAVTIFSLDDPATCENELRYRILSTVISDDGGGTAAIVNSTKIDAHLSVSYMDFSSLLDYAIISNSTIDIQPNNYVDGDVWLPDKNDLSDPKRAINGTIYDSSNVSLAWPDAEDLKSYYWNWVKNLTPSTDGQINIPAGTSESNPHVIEPLSSVPQGRTLTVKGDGWIRLGGTVYVKGDLVFNPTPSIAVNLNQETIFVEGTIKMGPKVTLTGSGCIIAVGNIDFQPSISSGEGDFVLVMSIGGTTTLRPNGIFTGCVAGRSDVQLQPNCGIHWISPEGKGLDFPMGIGDLDEMPPVTGLTIESWEIE